MKPTTVAGFVPGLISITLACGAFARGGFDALDESPVSQFTDEDWEVFRHTARKALDEAKPGDTGAWNNDKTGASGSITIIAEAEPFQGLVCRRARFFNSANGITGTSVFRVCKRADGQWRIAPSQ